MFIRSILAFSAVAAGLSFAAPPASAMTMAECSARYNAAKDNDTLDGKTWNEFRKAECGTDAATTEEPAKADNGKTKKVAASDQEEAKGLTPKQCSAKFQAAKAADALGGMKWNDFRKAECGPGTTAEFVATRPDKKTAKAKAAAENGGKGLSMSECSAKYKDAKADGSLNGMKWNDFRKSECGANAADDDTVPAIDEASYTDEPERPVAKAPRGVKFPNGVSSKFSDETPAKARMRTCLEQYYANKDADTLNGLRWIQKGGGYYSLCNARLKNES
jgi:hypothetical protein